MPNCYFVFSISYTQIFPEFPSFPLSNLSFLLSLFQGHCSNFGLCYFLSGLSEPVSFPHNVHDQWRNLPMARFDHIILPAQTLSMTPHDFIGGVRSSRIPQFSYNLLSKVYFQLLPYNLIFHWCNNRTYAFPFLHLRFVFSLHGISFSSSKPHTLNYSLRPIFKFLSEGLSGTSNSLGLFSHLNSLYNSFMPFPLSFLRIICEVFVFTILDYSLFQSKVVYNSSLRLFTSD